jgi:hypothetical protein
MVLRHRLGWDAQFTQRSPWFWPLSAGARLFASAPDWPARSELDAMYTRLTSARSLPPLRFAEPSAKRPRGSGVRLDQLYDGRIALLGQVPTRERDWHDFFNAICFAVFARAKRALHQRQFRALERRVEPGACRLPGTRTREQDALTLFDEGGAVIAAEPRAFEQLSSADESARPAVLAQCAAVGSARIVPFGHALFEHLVEGLRCPGGSTRLVCIESVQCDDPALLDQVDRALSAALQDPTLFLHPREGDHLRLDALGLSPARPSKG